MQQPEERFHLTFNIVKRDWEAEMLLLLAVILFIAWILGFVAFHVTVGLIHLLLVLAVIALVWHLVTGRRAAV
jgi:hypothetical protein